MKAFYWFIIIGILILIFGKKATVMGKALKEVFLPFIKGNEGFRSQPYWDRKQWSWGYGTRVPGSIDSKLQKPVGSIDKVRAAIDAFNHAMKDYSYLDQLIKIDLNSNQWAALLSFSYQLGRGNADNLVKNINAMNWDAVRTQWLLYVDPGSGLEKANLARRKRELDLFFKK